MKQQLIRMMPTPVVNMALMMRGKSQLNAVPRQAFDASNLRDGGGADFKSVFTDPAVQALWERDQAEISQVFQDSAFITGGVNPGDRRALYSLIAGLRPERVLEIGTHIGASTLYIAKALQTYSETSRMTTVDIVDVNDGPDAAWKSSGLPMSPAGYATRLGCRDRIHFEASPSLDFLKTTNEAYDFIFLDGDHEPQTVYREVSAALPRLNPNGLILLHDYYPDSRPLFGDGRVLAGPYLALRRISDENPEITAFPLGALPWTTKQGSRVTSLAIVTRDR